MFKPVGEFLLVKLDEKEEKTKGGIYIPEGVTLGKKVKLATIMAIGNEVDATIFKAGDKVAIFVESGISYEDCHIIRVTNIYGIVYPD